MKKIILLTLLCAIAATKFLSLDKIDLVTDSGETPLDLKRINGTWYSIASVSVIFEVGCHCPRTTYILQADNSSLENTDGCRLLSNNGIVIHSPSTKMTTTDANNRHWDLSTFWNLVHGNFDFVKVDTENYQWALTSSKNKTVSWVLAKTKTLDAQTLLDLKTYAESLGINTDWEYHDQTCPDFV